MFLFYLRQLRLAVDKRGPLDLPPLPLVPAGELTFEVGLSEVNRKHFRSFWTLRLIARLRYPLKGPPKAFQMC